MKSLTSSRRLVVLLLIVARRDADPCTMSNMPLLLVQDYPVDKFLLGCLQQGNPSLTHFLNQSENTIRSFCLANNQYELAFPPLNSFHRRIIHCLGRLYGLERAVEETNLFNSESTVRRMNLSKGEDYSIKSIPLLKCKDLLEETFTAATAAAVAGDLLEVICEQVVVVTGKVDNSTSEKPNSSSSDGDNVMKSTAASSSTNVLKNSSSATSHADSPPSTAASTGTAPSVAASAPPKIKILKRNTNANTNTNAASDALSPAADSAAAIRPSSPSPTASIQEREALYQAARERIFKDFTPEPAVKLKLNPNAQSFAFPAPVPVQVPPTPEPIPFAHIFTFTAKAPLSRPELLHFCRETNTQARLFEFPVMEGFLLGSAGVCFDRDLLAEWQVEVVPFVATKIYE